MPSPIKFDLKIEEKHISDIEELRDNFNIDDILLSFKNKSLHRWLKVRNDNGNYSDTLQKLSILYKSLEFENSIEINQDLKICKELCIIFDISGFDDFKSEYERRLKRIKEKELEFEKKKMMNKEIQDEYEKLKNIANVDTSGNLSFEERNKIFKIAKNRIKEADDNYEIIYSYYKVINEHFPDLFFPEVYYQTWDPFDKGIWGLIVPLLFKGLRDKVMHIEWYKDKLNSLEPFYKYITDDKYNIPNLKVVKRYHISQTIKTFETIDPYLILYRFSNFTIEGGFYIGSNFCFSRRGLRIERYYKNYYPDANDEVLIYLKTED